MQQQYLIEPFNIRIQFSFRNSYDADNDEYKYKIGVMADKVKLNLNPMILNSFQNLREHIETYSYAYDIKRFRPLIKIQSFINLKNNFFKGKKLPPEIEKKRKAVIKDWFRLILWYIRIRKLV
jgi:hypothetical protein